jgi:trehalose utilization protein
MGLVVLHSGHFSKPFKRVLGSNASLLWREADEKERLWNLQPSHPIMEGSRPTSSSSRRRCTASASTSRRPTSC